MDVLQNSYCTIEGRNYQFSGYVLFSGTLFYLPFLPYNWEEKLKLNKFFPWDFVLFASYTPYIEREKLSIFILSFLFSGTLSYLPPIPYIWWEKLSIFILRFFCLGLWHFCLLYIIFEGRNYQFRSKFFPPRTLFYLLPIHYISGEKLSIA